MIIRTPKEPKNKYGRYFLAEETDDTVSSGEIFIETKRKNNDIDLLSSLDFDDNDIAAAAGIDIDDFDIDDDSLLDDIGDLEDIDSYDVDVNELPE